MMLYCFRRSRRHVLVSACSVCPIWSVLLAHLVQPSLLIQAVLMLFYCRTAIMCLLRHGKRHSRPMRRRQRWRLPQGVWESTSRIGHAFQTLANGQASQEVKVSSLFRCRRTNTIRLYTHLWMVLVGRMVGIVTIIVSVLQDFLVFLAKIRLVLRLFCLFLCVVNVSSS